MFLNLNIPASSKNVQLPLNLTFPLKSTAENKTAVQIIFPYRSTT